MLGSYALGICRRNSTRSFRGHEPNSQSLHGKVGRQISTAITLPCFPAPWT